MTVAQATTASGRQHFALYQFGTGSAPQFRRAGDQSDRVRAGGQLPSFAIGRLPKGPRTAIADHCRVQLGAGATVWFAASCGEIQKMIGAERLRGERKRGADIAGHVASDGMRGVRSGVGQSHFAIVPRGRAIRN
ncbi:MAG: hypothetical protein OXF40_07910 [Rhodospirillales bacterium]|nr:hypothetical protein [Rhodospirillales bacterium]